MRCGEGIGSCPDDKCCSKKSYCGTTSGYCSPSEGCQAEYGKCTNYRCGPSWGRCLEGQCCSKKGFYGTTCDYCFMICLEGYGKNVANLKHVMTILKIKKKKINKKQ